jgi:hypothetical protein
LDAGVLLLISAATVPLANASYPLAGVPWLIFELGVCVVEVTPVRAQLVPDWKIASRTSFVANTSSAVMGAAGAGDGLVGVLG